MLLWPWHKCAQANGIAKRNPTIKEITMAFVFQYEITVSYIFIIYSNPVLLTDFCPESCRKHYFCAYIYASS